MRRPLLAAALSAACAFSTLPLLAVPAAAAAPATATSSETPAGCSTLMLPPVGPAVDGVVQPPSAEPVVLPECADDGTPTGVSVDVVEALEAQGWSSPTAPTSGLRATVDPGSISGRVVDAQGAPLGGVCVQSEPLNFATGGTFRGVFTQADGLFTLTDLAPTTYLVSVQDCSTTSIARAYAPGVDRRSLATPVVVTSGGTAAVGDVATRLGATISGTVRADGVAVPGVCVTARSPSFGFESTSTTADGSYVLDGLAPGRWQVGFRDCSASGLLPQWAPGQANPFSSVPVAVAPGAAVTGVDAALVRGGTVTGTVRDTAGTPVAGACVGAESLLPAESVPSVTTASDGTYALRGLPSGTHLVSAFRCGDRDSSPDDAPAWVGGATRERATRLVVTGREQLSGRDVVLAVLGSTEPAPSGSLAGTLVDEAGTALADMCVDVLDATDGSVVSGTNGEADGTWSVGGLPAGQYRVEAQDCSFVRRHVPTTFPAPPAEPLSLAEGETRTGVRIQLSRGAAMTGRALKASTGAPLPFVCVSAGGDDDFAFGTTVGQDGTWRVAGLRPNATYSVFAYDCFANDYREQFSPKTAVAGATGTTTSLGDEDFLSGGEVDLSYTSPGPWTCLQARFNGSAGGGFGYGFGSFQASGASVRGVRPGTHTLSFGSCSANRTWEFFEDASTSDAATPVTVTAGRLTDLYTDLRDSMDDRDEDGDVDAADSCDDIPNADQANRDGDALGDACDALADVSSSDGFEPFVRRLLAAAVTSGCGVADNGPGVLYCTTGQVTREQMAVFLMKAQGVTAPPAYQGQFADVAAGSPFAPWIAALVEQGITAGCGTDAATGKPLYCPTGVVNREQMAVFLLKAQGVTADDLQPYAGTFTDVPESSGFARWIEELVRRGVTAGIGDGKYGPKNAVTRGQMAVFLSKAFALPPV